MVVFPCVRKWEPIVEVRTSQYTGVKQKTHNTFFSSFVKYIEGRYGTLAFKKIMLGLLVE